VGLVSLQSWREYGSYLTPGGESEAVKIASVQAQRPASSRARHSLAPTIGGRVGSDSHNCRSLIFETAQCESPRSGPLWHAMDSDDPVALASVAKSNITPRPARIRYVIDARLGRDITIVYDVRESEAARTRLDPARADCCALATHAGGCLRSRCRVRTAMGDVR